VRTARVSDRDALQALWQEIDQLHAGLMPRFFRATQGERDEANLRRALSGPTETVLVAEDASESVRGLSHVQLYDTPQVAGLQPGRRAHLDSLVVARAYRRSGCGRALAEASADWARVRGAKQLLLTVWAGNQAAERFYAALGYHVISQVLGTDL
jgi:ribosomal protein S18 acetylase RimI-like enzyme